ncbi:esterase family protein [Parabacteroides acidifaciens]|uniref:Esterase family protein n=1 Tax=Parabacteroides acidifaciens TaxID=2290935 RepID=A0A3D8HB94_9BACT|nr:alpha/beta hydrolase-fold protein [Parabacteroides acidifaciens]MBC8602989.1 esterase family protein [Parabacteroides acidifaciens]RDU48256.1 esterase family protein [Parabacteroides acidifaciens]
MKNKVCLSLILCLLVNLAGYSQSAVFESLSFDSQKLGRKVSYSIYLPSDYNTSKRNYPVLYLLHGYTDNETNWIHMGQMKTITDRAIANEEAVPMIIVMPDAWDTWYVNQYDGKVPYEDMFFEELIPYMEKTYRVRSNQESRAIAGLSMGGYGSFLYSLHHPDMFCACAPLSAAVFDDSVMDTRKAKSHKDLFNRLFGPGDEHWHKNSVEKILSDWDENKLPNIRYYIDCGDKDGLLEGNFQVHQIMRQKNIKHEFRVHGGGHSWTYWRTALPEVLKFVSQTFSRS